MGANPLWGEDWEQVRRLWPLDDAVLHRHPQPFVVGRLVVHMGRKPQRPAQPGGHHRLDPHPRKPCLQRLSVLL